MDDFIMFNTCNHILEVCWGQNEVNILIFHACIKIFFQKKKKFQTSVLIHYMWEIIKIWHLYSDGQYDTVIMPSCHFFIDLSIK